MFFTIKFLLYEFQTSSLLKTRKTPLRTSSFIVCLVNRIRLTMLLEMLPKASTKVLGGTKGS
jgi:hypothetical protein